MIFPSDENGTALLHSSFTGKNELETMWKDIVVD